MRDMLCRTLPNRSIRRLGAAGVEVRGGRVVHVSNWRSEYAFRIRRDDIDKNRETMMLAGGNRYDDRPPRDYSKDVSGCCIASSSVAAGPAARKQWLNPDRGSFLLVGFYCSRLAQCVCWQDWSH